MKREEVYNRINRERDYQDQFWGGTPHDEGHNLGDWLVYMQHYMDRAKIKYTTSFKTNEDTLHELRKVVALGIACFEQTGVPEREGTATVNVINANLTNIVAGNTTTGE